MQDQTPNQSPIREVSPAEVKQLLDRGAIRLIDVREPEEAMIAGIEGAELYPLSQSAGWINDLPRDKPLVIVCHHGARSTQVANALIERGYPDVANMTGGIDAWSQTVDTSVPRY